MFLEGPNSGDAMKMFKLLQASLLLLPVLALSACHDEVFHEDRQHDSDFDQVSHVPAGGASFGTFNQFEHDFSTQDIDSYADRDGFTFSLAEESTVMITVSAAGGLDSWMDLYDNSFFLLTGDDNSGPGLDPVLVVQLDAGSYTVVVGGVGDSQGSYDFDIVTGSLGGVDFGFLSASTLYFDDGGAIDSSADFDTYYFTITSAQVIDFELFRLTGNYDGNLQLVDQFGQEVFFNDPAGDANPGAFNVALNAGTYMLVVAAGTGSGTYEIDIDVQ